MLFRRKLCFSLTHRYLHAPALPIPITLSRRFFHKHNKMQDKQKPPTPPSSNNPSPGLPPTLPPLGSIPPGPVMNSTVSPGTPDPKIHTRAASMSVQKLYVV